MYPHSPSSPFFRLRSIRSSLQNSSGSSLSIFMFLLFLSSRMPLILIFRHSSSFLFSSLPKKANCPFSVSVATQRAKSVTTFLSHPQRAYITMAARKPIRHDRLLRISNASLPLSRYSSMRSSVHCSSAFSVRGRRMTTSASVPGLLPIS